MPFKCCVPSCKGNYDNGPKVSVFGFPKEENLRKQWIQAIKRKDFVPNNNSKVCELHFQEELILKKLIETPLNVFVYLSKSDTSSEVSMQVASYAYVIVQKLLNIEEMFLKQEKHSTILQNLIFKSVTSLDEIFLGHSGNCHDEDHLIKLLVKPISNIMLKNYVKKKNDRPTTKHMPDVKRFKPGFKT